MPVTDRPTEEYRSLVDLPVLDIRTNEFRPIYLPPIHCNFAQLLVRLANTFECHILNLYL
jgi:hypothetical protein